MSHWTVLKYKYCCEREMDVGIRIPNLESRSMHQSVFIPYLSLCFSPSSVTAHSVISPRVYSFGWLYFSLSMLGIRTRRVARNFLEWSTIRSYKHSLVPPAVTHTAMATGIRKWLMARFLLLGKRFSRYQRKYRLCHSIGKWTLNISTKFLSCGWLIK